MEPTVPARYRRTVVTNYLYAASLIAVAVGVTPVLVRTLGKTEFGIWILVGSLALYLELLEFGFGGATIKKIAQLDAVGSRQELRQATATSFWILAVPGLIALIAGIVISVFFSSIFDIPAELETAALVVCLLITFDLAISIPSDTFGGVLIGLQRYDLLNTTLLVVVLTQAAGWVIVLALGGGLIELAIVTVVVALLGQVSRFLLARRLLGGPLLSPRLVQRRLVRPLAGMSVWFSLSEIATVVTLRIDPVVVGIIVGVPEAAVYAVGQKLALACTQLVNPLTDGFFPLSSELDARGDRARLRGAILTGTRISLALAIPIALTVAILADPAIEAWVGGGYEEAGIVVVLLVANAALAMLTGVGIRMLMGTGSFRYPSLALAAEAAANLGLSIGLGLKYGIVGVALGSLLSTALVHVVLAMPYIARTFELSLVGWIASLLRAHLVPGVATGLLGWGLLTIGVDGLGPVVGAGLAMMVTYLGLLWVTGLDSGERGALLKLARNRRASHA
ncbi:MAG: oligosaccharide flippase family protein [Gaiellaceae bacterium]